MFGAYPKTSLADAWLRRAEAKVALGQGTDPGAKETPVVITTFEQAARAWHANRLASLDAGHASRLLARLEKDALDLSRRFRLHVSQIYRFAIPQGRPERDPAEHLTDLLKPKPRTKHMA